MGKKMFENPELEIVKFQTVDVITISGPGQKEDDELPFVPTNPLGL